MPTAGLQYFARYSHSSPCTAAKEAKLVESCISLTAKDDVIEVFHQNHVEQVSSEYFLKAKNIVLEAAENITIKVGNSYIAIESDGISIGSLGKIEINTKSDLALTGAAGLSVESSTKIDLSSPKSSVEGDTTLTLKGGMVNIN